MMQRSFVSTIKEPAARTAPALWFAFQNQKLLVCEVDGRTEVPRLVDLGELGLAVTRTQYLGYQEGHPPTHCYSAEIAADAAVPKGMRLESLRALYGQLDDSLFWLAGRAVQIVDWDRTHQYCSCCGVLVESMTNERAKKCPQCGFTSYPRLSPAMIVRVTRQGERGPEILLARAHHFRPGLYSVLAGFVEPGETVEACVKREVCEEVGIEIENIRYFGSQPWPFPNSLMLAFTADYASGEIQLEQEEMDDAGWFSADGLPDIPPPISISRRLIDDFLNGQGMA